MTQKQNLRSQFLLPKASGYQVLIGAEIALLFIGILLMGVKTNHTWSQYWTVRPFIIVPLAGAMGGAFYYFMGNLRSRRAWKKASATILSFIVYLAILWLGTVLELDGTLWH